MGVLITGVAGFVGANLAARLTQREVKVFGLDNLCRGDMSNLAHLLRLPNFRFEVIDLADLSAYRSVMMTLTAEEPVSEIWHLAANSDIPAGIENPDVDLKDTFMTTFNTLRIMREFSIDTLSFASSSAIYGDAGSKPLVEDTGPLFPISNYGAMKLASEAAISAAVESHLRRAFVFRFPNVVGVPATHGVILDFIRKLQATPEFLEVLGDGTQQKGYLHVDDLIDAMLFVRERSAEKLSYFNVGATDAGVTVRFIAEQVVRHVAPAAKLRFGTGNKGWVGDVPRFSYSTEKLAGLGWSPNLNSEQSVLKAIRQIVEQEWRN